MMKNSARKVQRKSASHWQNSKTINHSRTIPLSNRWHTVQIDRFAMPAIDADTRCSGID